MLHIIVNSYILFRIRRQNSYLNIHLLGITCFSPSCAFVTEVELKLIISESGSPKRYCRVKGIKSFNQQKFPEQPASN